MDAVPKQSADLLTAGWQALATGAWNEARVTFAAALDINESGEALEGLATATWWLNDFSESYRARELAYRRFNERGDRHGAARSAIGLASDHYLRRGEHAIANGWLQRARHLLDGLDLAPEHSILAGLGAHMAVIIEHDTVTARRLSAEAADVARSLGVLDLEMLAQAVNGFAHVCEGDVAEGMRLLDEATTAAVAGEMTDLDSITVSCCCLIYACERVRDIGRAAQWCDKLRQITARWSYQAMFAYCRTHYAGVLIARGEWQEAESELTTAMAELDATYQAFAFEAIVRLAELRRLQGRLEEADELLSRLDHHPLRMLGASPALLGRAGLALEAGDPTSAVDLAERHLRSIGTEAWIDQVDGLEVLVLAHVVLGELDRAAERLHDLVAITTVVPTPLLRASARYAGGALARAVGDLDEARRRFEDAVDLAEQGGSRYHAARARLELAEVLVTLKRTDAAGREARAALQVMAEIGAARATARAEDLFDRLERSIARGADGANNGNVLTPREIDVLRLISQGKNNREAAEVLGLSEHTVHRHVSNILTKLNLPSRAAAVAHASQHGLL